MLLAMLGTLAINKAWLLFSRPFWLDEFHTVFVANAPNLPKLLQDLAQGADFNPPVLPVLLHAVGRLTGELTPTVVRTVSFVCTWLGLLLVYAAVRPHRERLVALGASLLLWTSPLTVSQAFQGRFYAPWLLLTIAYALTLFGRSDAPPSRWRTVGIAVFAVLLCNIHYFGIVSWGLLAVGLLPWVTRTTGAFRRVLPSLAGPISLAAVVPMYAGQRAVLGTMTWVLPLSSGQVYELLTYLVAWPSVLGLMLLYVLVAGRTGGRTDPSKSAVPRWSSIEMALFLLMGLVAFLVVFSALAQPVTVTRYAMPALLAWVPIGALALHRIGTLPRVLALAGIWVFSIGIVREQVREQTTFRDRLREDAVALATMSRAGLPLVAADRFALYPLSKEAELSGVPIQLVELPDTASTLNGSDLLERSAGRAHARLYGFPKLASIDAITQAEGFVLFADDTETEKFAARWFPEYSRRRINSRIYELRRSVR